MDEKQRQELKRRAAAAKKPDVAPTAAKPLNTDLEKAKVLIQQKKYDDARALLVTIDDPTADKWLARLEQIAPARPAAGVPQPVVIVKPPRKIPTWLKVIGAVVLVLVAMFGLMAVYLNATMPKIYASTGITTHCRQYDLASDCIDYADQVMARSEAQVMECFNAYPEFEYRILFEKCLVDRGILPD